MSSMFAKQLANNFFRHIVKGSIRMSSTKYTFDNLAVTVPKAFVYQVELNRPQQLNAQTKEMWIELRKCFDELNVDPDCRVVVLTGSGKMFTAGLDFKAALETSQELGEIEDVARKAKYLRDAITKGQEAFTCMENCNKPVIAAIHNGCIGGGVSLITAADIRYCTKDAWFQVKEVLLGLTCDVGALQRFPRCVGYDGLVRELCFTGRRFNVEEAFKIGLVTKVFDDKESMMSGVMQIAEGIAANSPVAVQGTKRTLIFSRDHSVKDGLEYVATFNQAMLQSEDFITGVTALVTKQKDVQYSKL